VAASVRARSRPHRALSDSAIAAAIMLAALGVALFTSVRAPDMIGQSPLVIAPFVALPVWLLVTNRPELGLAVLLLYLGLVDGFIKLKVGTELPTIGRDVLLYALAIGMLMRAKFSGKPLDLPPLTGWVAAFVLVVLVQLLNPANQSSLHSVAALRQHIEFVPLFFIGYALMRSKQRLRIFFLLLLLVANVNGAVSLMQFNLSPEQLASWGPGYSNLINGVGSAPRTAEGKDGEKRVRPPGLGSDMGFAGNLGAVALPGALALLALGRFNRRQAFLAAALTPGAVVAIVTSQSRSVVVVAVVAVIVFATLALLAGQALRIALGGLVALVLGLSAISFVGHADEGAFYRYSSVQPGQLFGTTVDSRSHTISQIPKYAQQFPLGAGIGSVGPAAAFEGEPRGLNAESQFTFMIVELGVIGLLVYMAFQVRLMAMVLPGIRRLQDREARLLIAALITPLVEFIAMWIIGVTTTSTPNAPYIWFAAGTAAWWVYRSEIRVRPAPAPLHAPPVARPPVPTPV
jgi:O-Antigen ligase